MEEISTPSKKLSQAVETELNRKILLAQSHCLTTEEEKEIDNKLIEGTRILRERELTEDEAKYYYSFRERLNQSSIIVDTLPEARRVMELLGFDDYSLIDTLSHENAHANKATQVGARFEGYRFALVKDTQGYLLVYPMAITSIPEDWDYKKRKKRDSQIIRAPEEYGHRMSEGDKQLLKIKYGE